MSHPYLRTIIIPSLLLLLLASCAGMQRGNPVWDEQVADARMVMMPIHHANRFYHNDLQKDALSVAELEEKEYLAIDDESKARFDFSLILENGELIAIRAVSTAAFVGGPGWELMMDVRTGKFSGALAR